VEMLSCVVTLAGFSKAPKRTNIQKSWIDKEALKDQEGTWVLVPMGPWPNGVWTHDGPSLKGRALWSAADPVQHHVISKKPLQDSRPRATQNRKALKVLD